MMDTLVAIVTRRSVRSFRPDPVPDEVVESLLTAAMSGPSTGSQQPWQFVVVRSRAALDRLGAHSAYRHALAQAPVAVVVCGDMKLSEYGEH